MVQQRFRIANEMGLHIRPASALAAKVKEYQSSIIMLHEDAEYNAKSVIGILSACVKKGQDILIVATGPDEDEAIRSLNEIFQSGQMES